MAKLKFTGETASITLSAVIHKETLQFNDENFSQFSASFDDLASNWRVSLLGSGIERNTSTITAGEIESVWIRSQYEQVDMMISGLDYAATDLATLLTTKGITAFMSELLKGDDTIIGSYNNDVLSGLRGDDKLSGGEGVDVLIGGRGDDVLRGGAELDTFVFSGHFDHDRVVDFDAVGGSGKQDHIVIDDDATYAEIETHNGLKLDFGHGDTIFLRDVTAAQFSAADVYFASET